MTDLPFDLATVDWVIVAILAGIAFLAALIGNAVAFGNRLVGAIFTGIFFAVFYVLWHYWLKAMVIAPAVTPPL